MLIGWWPGRTSRIVAVCAAVVFVIIAALVYAAGIGPVGPDLGITRAFRAEVLRSEHQEAIWSFVTKLGEFGFVTLAEVGLFLACVLRRRPDAALVVAICGIGYPMINRTVKAIVDRPRPNVVDSAVVYQAESFPSGHTGAATCLAMLIFCVVAMSLPKLWRAVVTVLALGLAVGVGMSRMALGVHYPTDVIAGWTLPVVWVLSVSFVVRRLWDAWESAGRLPGRLTSAHLRPPAPPLADHQRDSGR